MDRRLAALLLGVAIPVSAFFAWRSREGASAAASAKEVPRGGAMGGPLIRWERDYGKAVADARREGKLLLLYFTAEW